MTTERSPSGAWHWIGAVLAGTGFGGASAYALTQVLGPASSGLTGAWQATPVATASTFFIAPPSSAPSTSLPV